LTQATLGNKELQYPVFDVE